jgi:hypothetical protein
MSESARYNAEAGLMQVRFSPGKEGGVGNTYQYDGIAPDTWRSFMAARLGGGSGTATYVFLMSRGGVRI